MHALRGEKTRERECVCVRVRPSCTRCPNVLSASFTTDTLVKRPASRSSEDAAAELRAMNAWSPPSGSLATGSLKRMKAASSRPTVRSLTTDGAEPGSKYRQQPMMGGAPCTCSGNTPSSMTEDVKDMRLAAGFLYARKASSTRFITAAAATSVPAASSAFTTDADQPRCASAPACACACACVCVCARARKKKDSTERHSPAPGPPGGPEPSPGTAPASACGSAGPAAACASPLSCPIRKSKSRTSATPNSASGTKPAPTQPKRAARLGRTHTEHAEMTTAESDIDVQCRAREVSFPVQFGMRKVQTYTLFAFSPFRSLVPPCSASSRCSA